MPSKETPQHIHGSDLGSDVMDEMRRLSIETANMLTSDDLKSMEAYYQSNEALDMFGEEGCEEKLWKIRYAHFRGINALNDDGKSNLGNLAETALNTLDSE